MEQEKITRRCDKCGREITENKGTLGGRPFLGWFVVKRTVCNNWPFRTYHLCSKKCLCDWSCEQEEII